MNTPTTRRLLIALLAGLLMFGVAAVNAADLSSPAPTDADVYFIEDKCRYHVFLRGNHLNG
jgi:hypothetical protein